MATSPIAQVLDNLRAHKRVKPIDLVEHNPEIASVLSKMVPDREPARYDKRGNREIAEPHIRAFRNVSEHTSQSIQDADTVMNILTDMDLCKQILVSATLSPKDMGDEIHLRYTAPEGFFSPALYGTLINEVKRHHEEDYKIHEYLPKILGDVYFNTGSYAVAALPENSIDEAINGHDDMSFESFSEFYDEVGRPRHMGILGPAIRRVPENVDAYGERLNLESRAAGDYGEYDSRVLFTDKEFVDNGSTAGAMLHVTDNLAIFRMPYLKQRLREEAVTSIYRPNRDPELETLASSFESIQDKNVTDRELDAAIYGQRKTGYRPIVAFRTQEQLSRYAVGEPLVKHWPSEAVVPVFIPGTPDRHVGFFVLADSSGHPVTRHTNQGYYQQLSNRLNSNGNFPSAMLTKVKSMMTGFPSITDHQTDYSLRYYQQVVEADVLARFRNSHYGNGVALANRPEFYEIMLSRSLANQFTQMVFVPIEFMTYFAFQYSPDGIGQSYLDDLRVLNSMRAMTLFTHVMAQVNNSIPRTNVEMTLDPDDPDPWKSIEILTHEIVRSRQQNFPLGMNNPADITDWLQKASLKFGFKNHPMIPEVQLDFTETQTNYTLPNTELMEFLNRQAILKTGLTPDTVDAAMHAEFATSIVRNSLMLSKRIAQNQRQFEPQLSDHSRKEMLAHGNFMAKMRKILMDNFDQINVDIGLNRQTSDEAEQTLTDKLDEKNTKRFKDALKPDDQSDTSDKTNQTPESGEKETAAPSTPDVSNVPETSIPFAVVEHITKSGEQQDGKVKLNNKTKHEFDEYKKRYVVNIILERWIKGIDVHLPRPDTTSEENTLAEMEARSKLLDEAIENHFSEKLFSDPVVGEALAKSGEAIKANIKALYMRKWMTDKGILTELNDIAINEEDGKPKMEMWNQIRNHLQSIMSPLTQTIVELNKIQKAANQIIQQTDPQATEPSSDDTSGSSGDFDNSSGMPGFDDTQFDNTSDTSDTGNTPPDNQEKEGETTGETGQSAEPEEPKE